MAWIIVGLGNPGHDYDNTRHNTGRMMLTDFAKKKKLDEWKLDKKANALLTRGIVAHTPFALVQPETFMNKSGNAVAKFVKSVKAAERLIIVYDDLDLPLGKIKISFDRGSGGHKGIESIARAVKTKKFWRIRVGVSPSTAAGVVKKPQGEKAVNNFILGKFITHEYAEIQDMSKRVTQALEAVLTEGATKAMNQFNSL